MAQRPDPRTEPQTRSWIAFLTGAVVMLAIVLAWLAWSRSHDAVRTVRADIALPRPDLPSLPTTPPPEGPHLPPVPVPTPR
ncbi:MAG: hypothetical protein JWP49_458 [Phenylobacterium sp.]|jgi:hypothetical protein|nr:hypothetical protein [Phenylobacterium sp.]